MRPFSLSWAAHWARGYARAWRMGVRIDQDSVTVRSYFRTYLFSLDEVRWLTDGRAVPSFHEDGGDWVLNVVLCDGRTVAATGTARERAPRPDTLDAIVRAAERYRIPAELTGIVPKADTP